MYWKERAISKARIILLGYRSCLGRSRNNWKRNPISNEANSGLTFPSVRLLYLYDEAPVAFWEVNGSFLIENKGNLGGISSTGHLKHVKQSKTYQKYFVSPWVCVWPFDFRVYREDGERLSVFIALQFTILASVPVLSRAGANGAGLWLLRPRCRSEPHQRIFLMTLSHFTSPSHL